MKDHKFGLTRIGMTAVSRLIFSPLTPFSGGMNSLGHVRENVIARIGGILPEGQRIALTVIFFKK